MDEIVELKFTALSFTRKGDRALWLWVTPRTDLLGPSFLIHTLKISLNVKKRLSPGG